MLVGPGVPTSNLTRRSFNRSRAKATYAGEGSIPTTLLGEPSARMVSASAPVPQPTSNQRLPGGTASHPRSSRATRRLQRPT